MNTYKYNRRQFIKMASMASAGLSTSATSLFNLRNLNALTSQYKLFGGDDYKAMVCLYFGGGADSFNMIVPRGNAEYAEYAATRSNLALAQDELLPISPINVGGINYGLHPALTSLQNMFNDGHACFLTNVGTLVDHTTKDQFINDTAKLPLGLFSHSDQSNQWQTASTAERLTKGWAGRISDLQQDVNTNSQISMNVSFNGSNTFQSSNGNVEYSVNNDGAIGLTNYEETYEYHPKRRKAIDDMMSQIHSDPFKSTYVTTFKNALDANLQFNSAIRNVPDFTTDFSDNYLSRNFAMIAKIISARQELGFKRQIFFIDYGGWDTHDELLNDENYLLQEVDTALEQFRNVLAEIGMTDNVVTFTMSEFARTLTSNGNGTDHAWGGNVIAMGGPVNGNRIFGSFPSLVLDNDLDIGGGVLIPTLPNDLYFAELALWFGVSPNDLHTIFPNLGNFYAQGSTTPPIGFLNY